ncbi:MAG: DEAD/DEAH box helicase, partial [Verrucomicrobiales bacterium]
MPAQPRDLPIYEVEKAVLRALGAPERARVLLSAPTGSGKSTQVPQMILDGLLAGGAGGDVVVLQPRRIAARMLASRVASERGGNPGGEVGYQVRFDSRCGRETRIRYVTEGILMRRLLDDPELRGTAVVIFDEFHERHLYGDITLARVLALQEKERPELKIVVMSATLELDLVEAYLDSCVRVSSEGRTFPVDVVYRPEKQRSKASTIWERAARACAGAAAQVDGDILVFMPGAYEIRRTIEALERGGTFRGWKILPLYGDLAPGAQDDAVRRYRQQKIIVATNVAETSLTIEGVRIVVDSGLARVARYDPRRGIDTLSIETISQAAA